MLLKYKGQKVADLPLDALSTKAPVYDREWKKHKLPEKIKKIKKLDKIKIEDALIKILAHYNVCCKKSIWEQYDHTVMCDTIQKPGGDAAVVRIHGKNKGISMTVDSSPHYCKAHPFTGGKQVVCESWRNLISVGSRPIAITNCLNFGNPEKKEIMGQFVECTNGISEACKYLNYPVVSGNVSFYNETNNQGINPTPTIGGVGLIDDIKNMITFNIKRKNTYLMVIGRTNGHLDQSIFLREVIGIKKGPPPEINLFNEKNNGNTIQELIAKGMLLSVHDISLGGILISISEMCIAGNVGAKIILPKHLINIYEYLFGEDQSRYIIEIEKENLKNINLILEKNGVFGEIIAITQENKLELNKEFSISVSELKKTNNIWFDKYFNQSK